MKKLLYLLIAGSFFMVHSCEKESSSSGGGGGGTGSAIEGKWNLQNAEQKNGKITYDGADYATYTMTSSEESGYWQFNSDGTAEHDALQYKAKLTMIVGGFPQEQDQLIIGEAGTGTYTYNSSSKVLSITENSETFDYSVQELTSTTLKVKGSYLRIDNTGGVEIKHTADIILTFSR